MLCAAAAKSSKGCARLGIFGGMAQWRAVARSHSSVANSGRAAAKGGTLPANTSAGREGRGRIADPACVFIPRRAGRRDLARRMSQQLACGSWQSCSRFCCVLLLLLGGSGGTLAGRGWGANNGLGPSFGPGSASQGQSQGQGRGNGGVGGGNNGRRAWDFHGAADKAEVMQQAQSDPAFQVFRPRAASAGGPDPQVLEQQRVLFQVRHADLQIYVPTVVDCVPEYTHAS